MLASGLFNKHAYTCKLTQKFSISWPKQNI